MAVLVICSSFVGLSGCGGVVALGGSPSGSTKNDAVNLVATPATVDFGSVSIGSSANQKISIANNGSGTVEITQLQISNAGFQADGEGKLPVSLAAGSSLSLNVHFSPNDATDRTGQLNLISSASTTPAVTVSLHGKGSTAVQTAQLSGFNCNQSNVTGASSDSCTVTVSAPAPSGGVLVQLSSQSAAIKVPPSVTIPAGETSASFMATIAAASSAHSAVITATQGNVVKTFSIALAPANTATVPVLKALSCANTSFTGSGKTTCTVSLTASSPSAVSVTLASSGSAVKVPASVTIPAKSASASFSASVVAVSTAQTVTLSATSNESSKTVAIHLKASRSTAPSLTLSTSSLAFGSVAVGKSVTRSVTVTSTGTAAATITSRSISGAGFSISGGSIPATLKQGQTMALTVQFKPSSAGSVSGHLTISSNAGTLTVPLTGTGTDSNSSATISSLSCSSTSITGPAADSCNVTLSGPAPKGGLTVALASSSAKLTVPASVTIPAASAAAAFTADAQAVSSTQSVTLTARFGSTSKSISLQLVPAGAQLSVDATTIAFGSVVLNHATTQVVTLSSVGKAAVTVKSASVKGSGFSLSSVSLPATLNPGQTLLLTLIFDPTKTGSATGQLTITSNSLTNPSLTIPLTGTSTPHKVELNWDAPKTAVSKYRVYRATGGTGSFQNLAMTGQTTYTDTSVQSGQKYAYYVTSIGSSGSESKPSNTTTVTIP